MLIDNTHARDDDNDIDGCREDDDDDDDKCSIGGSSILAAFPEQQGTC